MLQNTLPASDPGSISHASAVPLATDTRTSEPLRITRWLCNEAVSDHVLESSPAEHLISLCLRATRLELRSDATTAFDGVMRGGALHVTGPSRRIVARMHAPCDILHLHVPTTLLQARAREIGADHAMAAGLDGCTVSDPLVEQLAKLMISDDASRAAHYATAIFQIVLTRALHLAEHRSDVTGLAKWRLRRVQALVEARLADPLTLGDMAAAAGLSRMHFAAQFRIASGSTPHGYLLCRRIEAAKVMLIDTDATLVEVALSVGFLAQAHFTTVFKRVTGDTPARWRRHKRDAAASVEDGFRARGKLDALSGALA